MSQTHPGVIEGISAITSATHDMARAVAFYVALGVAAKAGGEHAGFTGCPAGTGYLDLVAIPASQPLCRWGRVGGGDRPDDQAGDHRGTAPAGAARRNGGWCGRRPEEIAARVVGCRAVAAVPIRQGAKCSLAAPLPSRIVANFATVEKRPIPVIRA